MFTLRQLLLYVIVLSPASFQGLAEFTAQSFLPETVPCNASLTSKVPSTCKGRLFDEAEYDVWAVNLDFQFGKLSEISWKALLDQYTTPWAGPRILSGQTPLFNEYNSTRDYNLLDFLPVNIRALANHNFMEEPEPLPDGQPLPKQTDYKVYSRSILVPNCWTTVYETLRTMSQGLRDDVHVFHDVYSTDDKNMSAWLQSATEVVPGPFDQTSRKFGDVMFIYLNQTDKWRPFLEHAVMFIDKDIIWEKAGTGDRNPYRLTNIATVEKEWKPTTQGGLFQWELRRPELGVAPIKSFIEEFSLASQRPDARWPQFWQWPKELRRQYALAVADTQDPQKIDELTLLKARRYELCQQGGGAWQPCQKASSAVDDVVLV